MFLIWYMAILISFFFFFNFRKIRKLDFIIFLFAFFYSILFLAFPSLFSPHSHPDSPHSPHSHPYSPHSHPPSPILVIDSFPHGQYLIDGFHTPFRFDRNKSGGGILLYVREDNRAKILSHDFPSAESFFFFYNTSQKEMADKLFI